MIRPRDPFSNEPFLRLASCVKVFRCFLSMALNVWRIKGAMILDFRYRMRSRGGAFSMLAILLRASGMDCPRPLPFIIGLAGGKGRGWDGAPFNLVQESSIAASLKSEKIKPNWKTTTGNKSRESHRNRGHATQKEGRTVKTSKNSPRPKKGLK